MKKLSTSRLADTIARLRKSKNMTQAELSDATRINRALISRIEQQDFMPSIEQLESLGEALDFDITELFINNNKLQFRIFLSKLQLNIICIVLIYIK